MAEGKSGGTPPPGEGGPSEEELAELAESNNTNDLNRKESSKSEEETTESEGKIIVQETYTGEGSPWDFLEGLAAQAREQGHEITAQEILKQLEEQVEQGGEFSFDEMGTSSIEQLITPGTVIIIREVTVLEPARDESDDEAKPDEEKPEEEAGEKKKTSLREFREVLESPEGKELDSHLLIIKEAGQALMAELPKCAGKDESSNAVKFKSELIGDLQEAELLERDLKARISKEFGYDLSKELVPSYKILACIKNGYESNKVTMTDQAEIFDRVRANGEKLADVVDSAGGGA